jgi:uncharacterized protein (DUF58 family)
VLNADEIRLLDRLIVGAASAATAASSNGLRRSRERGVGLDFQEYRHYEPGDDPRSIDWTVEARLQQLVVRVPRAEGQSRMHILLDISASMGLGSPPKLTCAARAAAVLAYIATEHREMVAVSTFGDGISRVLPPAVGRVQLFRALELLREAQPSGASAIERSLMQYGAVARGPGLVTILSDFFEPGSGLLGMRFLISRGLTPAVVQIVTPEELRPHLRDATELVDIEGRADGSLVVDADVIASYLAKLEQQTRELRAFCLDQHLPYVRVESTCALAEMLSALERAGLVLTRG